MFSLIVTVLAIGLAIVIAVATVYYLGPGFNQSQAKALATRHVNEGSQLSAAIEAYRVEHAGSLPGSMDELVSSNYLRSKLAGNWQFGDNYLVVTDLEQQVCERINADLQIPGIPQCDAAEIQGKTACCVENQ